jgi:predicted sulfurtransferase
VKAAAAGCWRRYCISSAPISTDACQALKPAIAALCARHGVLGGLAVAREGLNGTVAGAASVASFLAAVLTDIYPCNVCSYQKY